MNSPSAAKPPVEPILTPGLLAFCVPFFAFMVLLALPDGIQKLGRTEFLFAEPKYWIFPLQTVVCGGLLAFYWRYYLIRWPKLAKDWALTLGIAVLVLAIWISPQELFGAAPRLEGFDPNVFANGSPTYWGSLVLRFARLVIVVPLLEEIFWRGFLLRYLIREDFEKVAFGTYSLFSFAAVSLCFALAHWGPDFWPALITGALYNFLAIRTKSLGACIIAHAVTNLILGLYIMQTGQWGFW
jgi:CAAX prenyl protease-like protein